MRIASFTLKIPTLAERKKDIPDIARALLKKCCHENNVNVDFKDIPHDFLEYLMKSKIEGNIRGIEYQLERLLVFSNRDSNGKPLLKNRRGIPGLYLKQDENLIEPTRESRNVITFRDLENKPFDVLGPHFPGPLPFMKSIQAKVLEDAWRKYPTSLQASKMLRVTTSYTSRLRHGIEAKRQAAVVHKKKKRSSTK